MGGAGKVLGNLGAKCAAAPPENLHALNYTAKEHIILSFINPVLNKCFQCFRHV